MSPRIRFLAALLALVSLPVPLLGSPAASVSCASAVVAGAAAAEADVADAGHEHGRGVAPARDEAPAPAGSQDDCPLGVSGHTACCFSILPPSRVEARPADGAGAAETPLRNALHDESVGRAPFHPPRA